VKKEKNEKNRNSIGCISNSGTVAANQPKDEVEQTEFFKEKSSVQGTGSFMITKTIEDKAIAIEVDELIMGIGNLAMESTEILNESANGTAYDSDGNKYMNYEHTKMIQFDSGFMMGKEFYTSPSFHGGNGASVEEFFNVTDMQKMETVEMLSMARVGDKQSLNFNTMDQFKGEWGTSAAWKKVCKKDITFEQLFDGDFAVQKNLIFEELIIPCSGKKDC
jgi:hypothetical protein